MNTPATIYREMLQKELSVFRSVTREAEILNALETFWDEARKEPTDPPWPADQRAARLIWAGVGFLAFGRLHHFSETMRTISRFPQSVHYSTCRYYVPGIERLLPLPGHLSALDNPGAVLDWFQSHGDKLCWDEEEGKFTCVGACTLPSGERKIDQRW